MKKNLKKLEKEMFDLLQRYNISSFFVLANQSNEDNKEECLVIRGGELSKIIIDILHALTIDMNKEDEKSNNTIH